MGDGKTDLAVACIPSGSVSILLGNGDGTFQPAVNYNPGAWPLSLAAGDFNGDGKLDLATADTDGISIFLGKGDGTFRHAPVDFAPGGSPLFVAVGDFNSDGRPDLAVA